MSLLLLLLLFVVFLLLLFRLVRFATEKRYDATAEVENESIAAREEFVLREQELFNASRAGR